MALRVAGNAHVLEGMSELTHQTEKREAVVDLASVLRISSHDERVPDAGRRATLEQRSEVCPVADHVCREVWSRRMPASDEPLAQLDRRLDPVGR
jgi:hypothetical protein